MLGRLAVLCARRRRVVFALWVVVVLAGGLAAPALFGRLESTTGVISGSESSRAADLARLDRPRGAEVYAVAEGAAATSEPLRTSVLDVARRMRELSGVQEVRDPYSGEGASAGISRDGRAIALDVRLAPTQQGWAAADRAVELLRTIEAPRVLVSSDDLLADEMDGQAASDLKRAELLGMPVVLLLLVLVFGGIVAAGLPVVVALVAVATTFVALLTVSAVTDVSVYSVNIVTMLGLGLAIDYSLLLVSRFREERGRSTGVEQAVGATFATAGRTVLFSGLTVAAALSGLLVFPDVFLRSMGLASLAVVVLDMLVALTLLPALLSVAARRIKPARTPGAESGAFLRIARTVRRRPLVLALLVGGLLVVLALPFATARFEDAGSNSLPASSPSRQLDELFRSRFAVGAETSSVTVVQAGGGALSAGTLDRYVARLRSLPGVADVALRPGKGKRAVLEVSVPGREQGPVALDAVASIRSMQAPVPVLVGGDAAELVDYQASLADRLPWAAGIVLVATFLLLFAFTGSVVLPLKAVVLTLTSLGAGLGALVWVFQDGHLGRLVGTSALGSLSLTTPVLLVAIAFGLSMDYEVFLLGRIKEEWEATGDADLAVERGLQRTGSVVTAAAGLMVVVFAGFVAGGFSPVKQVGLGLVLAVALDATLVRMVLLPAVMSLLGRRAWWAPSALRRLHARIGLKEETSPIEPSGVQIGKIGVRCVTRS